MHILVGGLAVAVVVIVLLFLWVTRDTVQECQSVERYSSPGIRFINKAVNACFRYGDSEENPADSRSLQPAGLPLGTSAFTDAAVRYLRTGQMVAPMQTMPTSSQAAAL